MRFIVLAFVLGATACTAAGSSTVISRPGDADSGTSTDDPFAGLDGGTTTTKDSGTPTTTDYESLFGPPSTSTTTPNSLPGLWAGTTITGNDMRVLFTNASILVAVQCSSTTVGLSVAAKVSSSSIKTLESKKTGQGSCTISLTPKEVASCVSTSYPCFTLNGTKVDLANFLGETGELTKLSD